MRRAACGEPSRKGGGRLRRTGFFHHLCDHWVAVLLVQVLLLVLLCFWCWCWCCYIPRVPSCVSPSFLVRISSLRPVLSPHLLAAPFTSSFPHSSFLPTFHIPTTPTERRSPLLSAQQNYLPVPVPLPTSSTGWPITLKRPSQTIKNILPRRPAEDRLSTHTHTQIPFERPLKSLTTGSGRAFSLVVVGQTSSNPCRRMQAIRLQCLEILPS